MGDLTVSVCRLVKGGDEHQQTLPAAVDIDAGQPIYVNSDGKYALADGSAAGTLVDVHVALADAYAGMPVTGVRGSSLLDVGDAISALAFGASVYVSNTAGTMSDTAGDVSKVIGIVVPSWAKTTVEKLLRVTL